ncbi:hypothetical protein JCM10207_007134 [Rhodosporidiobolus poonsookiae]
MASTQHPTEHSPLTLPYEGRLTLALAQSASVPGDVDRNLATHLRFIRLASSLTVDLVVFPELSSTGYELSLASDLAFRGANDARLDALAEACREARLTAVVGVPLQRADKLHIASVLLCSDGSRHVYTKQHLDNEDPPFSPGFGGPFLDFSDSSSTSSAPTRVALAICADTSVPAHPRAAASQGASAYLASSCISLRGYPLDTSRLASYARKHAGMLVGMANHAVPTGGLEARGGSAVWVGGDQVVRAELGGEGQALVVLRRKEDGEDWDGEVVPLRSK